MRQPLGSFSFLRWHNAREDKNERGVLGLGEGKSALGSLSSDVLHCLEEEGV